MSREAHNDMNIVYCRSYPTGGKSAIVGRIDLQISQGSDARGSKDSYSLTIRTPSKNPLTFHAGPFIMIPVGTLQEANQTEQTGSSCGERSS